MRKLFNVEWSAINKSAYHDEKGSQLLIARCETEATKYMYDKLSRMWDNGEYETPTEIDIVIEEIEEVPPEGF